ncbi:MAG: translation initiation factor IF-3 [Endomicrobiaceae bacterium]|nr:translation initiation factor IF-3 [Endomicrobiaceae bacterium]
MGKRLNISIAFCYILWDGWLYPFYFLFCVVKDYKEDIIDTRRYRTNQYIRVPEVRLIDENGAPVGIVPIGEALSRAQASGKDLIEISPQAKPPVCKILEFSKFRYELSKKEKESKKKQKTVQLKEVRLRTRIAGHDLEVKIKRIREFLMDGDNVQLTVMFSGREMTHKDLGFAILEKVKEQVADIAGTEGRIASMGTRSFLTLNPKKKELKK